MAVIDSDAGEIVIRLVYDGPPEAGKTTSLRALAGSLARPTQSPAEDANGRTLWFDWMEYVGGRFEGCQIRCQIVSVAGQRELVARRRRVIAGADVVVFVADSTAGELQNNVDYLEELREMLDGVRPPVGVIMQANKRDLPGATPLAELRAALARLGWPVGVVESIASAGTGIRETFVYAVRLALDRVREILAAGPSAAAASAGTAGTAEELLAVLHADEVRAARRKPALPVIDFAELDPADPTNDINPDELDFTAIDDADAVDAATADAAELGAVIVDAAVVPVLATDAHSLAAELFRGVLASEHPLLSAAVDNAFAFGADDLTARDAVAPDGEDEDDDEDDDEKVDEVDDADLVEVEADEPPLDADEPALAPFEAALTPVDAKPALDDKPVVETKPTAVEAKPVAVDETPAIEAEPTTVDAKSALDAKPDLETKIAVVEEPTAVEAKPAAVDVKTAAVEAVAEPPPPPAAPAAAPAPQPPTPAVPSGAIWPPVEGRAILQELSALDLAPRRLSTGDWIAGLGSGWRVMSSRDAAFSSLDDGRAALIQWARLHSGAADTLSAPRCIVLADDGAGSWRMWQLVRAQPSLRDAVDLALHESESRDALVAELRRIAQYIVEAEGRLSSLPVRLPCTLDNLGFSDTGVVYIGLMPAASTPVVEPRPRRESRNILHATLEPVIGRDLEDLHVALDDLLSRAPLPGLSAPAPAPTVATPPAPRAQPSATMPPPAALPAIPAPPHLPSPTNGHAVASPGQTPSTTANPASGGGGTPDDIARTISTLLGA